MFRRLSAALTCGAVATALVAAAPPAAVAGDDQLSRVVLRDGPGDVQRMVPPDTSSYPFGAFPRADVTAAVVAHRPRSVGVRMRFVDLTREGRQLYWLDVKTATHSFRVALVSTARARQGRLTFEEDDVAKACPDFTRRIDFVDDMVTMRIPRSCLGNPRWVRVQILNTLELRNGGPLYIDNPHNHKAGGGPTRRLHRP